MAEGREPRLFSTESLYKLSVCAVAAKFDRYKKYLNYLPENVLFDLYYQLYEWKKLCLLGTELSNLETFSKLLRVKNRRVHLLQIFQALMDHRTTVATELIIGYSYCCLDVIKNPSAQEKVINFGLRLGEFLSDGGWYSESEAVLSSCRDICLIDNKTPQSWCRTLEWCHKLLHTQATYYSFKGASKTHQLALVTIEKLKNAGYDNVNHAALYTEFSVLYFVRSEYDPAYKWSIKALKQLKPSLPPRITIDVLRQASKACVMKREFQKAGLLIKQAVYLAKEVFGTEHPKYSDVLSDYGFYLLNFDSIYHGVSLYKTALAIRTAIFGNSNLLVALSHEDLAYALYVYEYTSGTFQEASAHADKAIEIMDKLLPVDHLKQSSAKRVKALILEEIALLRPGSMFADHNLLISSLELQQSALRLVQNIFGEWNVQTAKHYGNLGRLYQSLEQYKKSEAMHLKAISIKEELLGPEDHEVGLSLGHLASLYAFHMNRYKEAERLYCRSIEIATKLFGTAYSGLEYDYRGLLHVYTSLGEDDKYTEYADTLNKWKELRDKHVESEDPPIDCQKRPEPIENIINEFFSM